MSLLDVAVPAFGEASAFRQKQEVNSREGRLQPVRKFVLYLAKLHKTNNNTQQII